MEIQLSKIGFSDYFLMFLLVFISGNPAAGHIGGASLYPFFVFVELFFYWKRIGFEGRRNAVRWTIFLIVIFIGQAITLKAIGILASANYIFKLLGAIFVTSILGEKFPFVYIKLISVLSFISLVLWGFNLIGVQFPYFYKFDNGLESLIIYTQGVPDHLISNSSVLRNNGMFWEPGAYAGYIMLVFFLFINHLDYLWQKYKREVIILFAALVSTFSTTGYIVMAFVIFVFLSGRFKNKISFSIISLVSIVLFLYIFNSVNFMGDKMRNEYANAVSMNNGEYASSRMGSLVMDLNYIKMHPIFGNGLLNETRFSQHMDILQGSSIGAGNGFSGEIAYFGIPFMLVFLAAIYNNPTVCVKKRWIILLLFILQMQGEYYMNYPLFLIFPFVFFFNKNSLQTTRV